MLGVADAAGFDLGVGHGADDAQALAKPAAGRLAEGAADEEQRQGDADGGGTAASRMDEEGREQQIAHACRGIEGANGLEPGEAGPAA